MTAAEKLFSVSTQSAGTSAALHLDSVGNGLFVNQVAEFDTVIQSVSFTTDTKVVTFNDNIIKEEFTAIPENIEFTTIVDTTEFIIKECNVT